MIDETFHLKIYILVQDTIYCDDSQRKSKFIYWQEKFAWRQRKTLIFPNNLRLTDAYVHNITIIQISIVF